VWLSPEEIEEIYEIREILVSAAVRRVVPQLTNAQLDRLDQIAERQERATNMATRTRLNHAFYATLFEPLNRPRLRALMDKLEREVERYLIPLDRPHLGHRDLVAACRRRDADDVAELLQRHLSQVRDRAVGRVRDLVSQGSPGLGQPEASVRRKRRSSVSVLEPAAG
jgi:DNA-binding GntR family transcriptional regulator